MNNTIVHRDRHGSAVTTRYITSLGCKVQHTRNFSRSGDKLPDETIELSTKEEHTSC